MNVDFHKRVLNLTISVLFCVLLWVRNSLLRMVGVRPRIPAIVIYYHVVATEHRESFALQMDMLLRRAKVVRADVTASLEPTLRHVAVTFDDGSETVLRNAFPELKKRGIPFTVFIISGMLGQPVSWEKPPERIMSADELTALCKSELVTIGSHTVLHPLLPRMTEASARAELCKSKAYIEALIQREVTLFAFPYGGFTENLVEWCRDAKYKRVFTTLPRKAFETGQEFVCGRVRVDPTDWPIEFYLKIVGAYCWLPYAIAVKKRLNLTIRPERLAHGAIEAGEHLDRTEQENAEVASDAKLTMF